MKRAFGPKNEREQLVFAIEELLADVQLTIQEAMAIRGVTRSELAKRLGCSPANVTQLLSEGANLQLETIARVFHSLGDTCEFRSRLIEEHREGRAAKEECRRERMAETPGGWRIWLRENGSKPQGETKRDADRGATSALIMEIAKENARKRTKQPENANVLLREDSCKAA